MKLYGYWRSSAAYRVRIALGLKGLAYENIPVSLIKAEHKGSEYKKLNPQGLVPFLVDGDFASAQSMAIIEYLEEKYPATPLLPPDAAGRAYVRALANVVVADIHPLNNLRVLKYFENEMNQDEAARNKWIQNWTAEGFAAFEAMLTRSGKCCLGDTPTIADTVLIPQFYNAGRFNCDVKPYPKIRAIAEYCTTLPAFAAARPENQPDAPK